uniref:Protein Malvolio n=1 Tax=Parascaris univalens TaxID=6257 RepID=A0A914ZMQ0_PARUN
MKNGKAPGIDGFIWEMLKLGMELLIKPLKCLFSYMVETELSLRRKIFDFFSQRQFSFQRGANQVMSETIVPYLCYQQSRSGSRKLYAKDRSNKSKRSKMSSAQPFSNDRQGKSTTKSTCLPIKSTVNEDE